MPAQKNQTVPTLRQVIHHVLYLNPGSSNELITELVLNELKPCADDKTMMRQALRVAVGQISHERRLSNKRAVVSGNAHRQVYQGRPMPNPAPAQSQAQQKQHSPKVRQNILYSQHSAKQSAISRTRWEEMLEEPMWLGGNKRVRFGSATSDQVRKGAEMDRKGSEELMNRYQERMRIADTMDKHPTVTTADDLAVHQAYPANQ